MPRANGDILCPMPRASPSAVMDGARSMTLSPSSSFLFPLGLLSCRVSGRMGLGRRCWFFKWHFVSQEPGSLGGRTVNAEQAQLNNCPPPKAPELVSKLLCSCLSCFLGRCWARLPPPPPPSIPAAPMARGLLDISVWVGGSQAQDGCGGWA